MEEREEGGGKRVWGERNGGRMETGGRQREEPKGHRSCSLAEHSYPGHILSLCGFEPCYLIPSICFLLCKIG